MIKIVKATTDEVSAIQSISRATFYEAFELQNNPEDFKIFTDKAFALDKLTKEVHNPSSQFYFAKDADKVVGYLKVNLDDAQTEPEGNDALEIERIYVYQAYQGKSIGKSFLEQAYEIAKSQHKKYVWLGVWEHNVKAIAFYKSQGFEIFGSHEFVIGSDIQTDWMMKKEVV
jgi:diamine N-acetyltransferase